MRSIVVFLTILFYFSINAQDTLIVGVKHSPPFIISNPDGHSYTGLCIDLWENIASETGYKYIYKEYDLEGILSSLADSTVDMCINPLSVTSERIKSIEFSLPVYVSHLSVAVKHQEKSIIVILFENLLSAEFIKTILFLALILFVVGFILWFFEKKKNPEQFRNGILGVFDGFWWSAVTMTTVGYGDKSPVTGVGRIIAVVWMFTAVIIISSFTAGISSALTVNKLKYSIESVKDLQKFSVATVAGSSTELVLKTQNIAYKTYETVDGALHALDNDAVEAVLFDMPILQYSIFSLGLEETIRVLPKKFNAQYYSFSFPKGSLLPKTISYHLIKKLEDEKWSTILSKYHLLK